MKPALQSAEELYPAFPRSTPIYAVVDKSKKKPRVEKYLKDEKYFAPPVFSEPNLPDLVTLRADVRAPASRLASARKPREASASSASAVSADDAREDNDITEALTVTDNETVYLSDDTSGDTTALTTEEYHNNTDTNMVKSHSANTSPNIEDIYVIENLNKSKHHKKKKSKKKKDEELFPRDPANLELGGRISNGSKGRASLEPSRHVVSRNHVA